LATGEKEKNILTGAYDIISDKNRKPAYIGSYDMVKAYARAMFSFLLKVMERTGFPEVFRRWIKIMHHEATTCLVLPNGLSRFIKVMFSFRQGDPLAMNLYILQKEPLLRMLRATLTGLIITNFKLIDKSYCDDVQILSSDVNELVKFDQVMQKFEETSGAILSRTKKSKVMWLGSLKSKQDWPEEVKWMKTVIEMKIFGCTVCPTYKDTVTKTWNRVVRGFEQVLFSWQSRQLETLSQRVQVARTFALSNLYYIAQVMPLPGEDRRKVESRLSSFIFRGRHKRLKLCELAEVGPVSHTMTRHFPLHQHMLDTFMESVGRGEIKNSNMRVVSTKEIYKSRMSSLLTPPKVELKFPLVNFPELV
jgi:hypothetical protein